MDNLSDLILDSKLDTRFDSKYTVHVYRDVSGDSGRRANLREEYWCYQSPIGAGAFGRIWLEKCIQGQQGIDVRAVKRISTKPRSQEKQINFNRELEAIAKFSHRKYEHCFIKSFGWYLQEDALCITMEYLQHGDLGQYMSRSPPLSEENSGDITYQILEGLSYMHDNNFAHRDLKPQNVLIKSCPPQPFWVKIGDFGISKRLEKETHGSTVLKGTMGFIAPELHGYTATGTPFAADMWSVAELSFQLMTKRPAFETPAIFAKYALQMTPEFPSSLVFSTHKLSSASQDFITSLMVPTPGERLTVHEALEHQWMVLHQPAPIGPAPIFGDTPDTTPPRPNSIHEELASWNTISTSSTFSTSALSDSTTTTRPNMIQEPGLQSEHGLVTMRPKMVQTNGPQIKPATVRPTLSDPSTTIHPDKVQEPRPQNELAPVRPVTTVPITETPYERPIKISRDLVPKEVLGQLSDRERKRQEVILEIIDSEFSFVRDLDYLRDNWIVPLQFGKFPILTPMWEEKRHEFVRTIFGNVVEIFDINSSFAAELSKRRREQGVVYNIGDIFLDFLPQFESFVKYGGNQMYARRAIEMEKSLNTTFLRFVLKKEGDKDYRSLDFFLKLPTTRLTRYYLLLDGAFRHTEDGNPDRKDIPKAIKAIMDLLILLNTENDKAENHFSLLHLQEHIKLKSRADGYPNLNLSDRNCVLLKKSTFTKGSTSEDAVQVYLFDNIVLMCVKPSKKRDDLVLYAEPFPLKGLIVRETIVSDSEKRTWFSLGKAKSKSSQAAQHAKWNTIQFQRGEGSDIVRLWADTKRQCIEFVEMVEKQQRKLREQSSNF